MTSVLSISSTLLSSFVAITSLPLGIAAESLAADTALLGAPPAEVGVALEIIAGYRLVPLSTSPFNLQPTAVQ